MTGLREVWVLTAHQLRRRWRSLLIWGLGLGAMGALYVALFPSMSGLMEDFTKNAPESLKNWLGATDGPMTAEQWMSMEFLSLMVPLALPFLVMLIGARTVAGDEERKNLDMLLANPVRRWHLIAGSFATMAISLTIVLALAWLLTYIAVPIAGVQLSTLRLWEAFVAIGPMCLLLGTFSLFMSTIVRRAFMATVIPAVVLVGMYVIQLLSEFSQTIKPARVVSLFYHLGSPVEGDFRLLSFLLMLAGSFVLAGGAAAAFAKTRHLHLAAFGADR